MFLFLQMLLSIFFWKRREISLNPPQQQNLYIVFGFPLYVQWLFHRVEQFIYAVLHHPVPPKCQPCQALRSRHEAAWMWTQGEAQGLEGFAWVARCRSPEHFAPVLDSPGPISSGACRRTLSCRRSPRKSSTPELFGLDVGFTRIVLCFPRHLYVAEWSVHIPHGVSLEHRHALDKGGGEVASKIPS